MFKYSKSQMILVPASFLVVAVITTVLFFWLNNKNEKIKKIPQKIVTIFIIICETVKYSMIIANGDYQLLYPS